MQTLGHIQEATAIWSPFPHTLGHDTALKMAAPAMTKLLLRLFAVFAAVGMVAALPAAEVDTPAQTCTTPSKRRSWYVGLLLSCIPRGDTPYHENGVLIVSWYLGTM